MARGKRRACARCGELHSRPATVDVCRDCDDGTTPGVALVGGHWAPGRHGVLRWVAA